MAQTRLAQKAAPGARLDIERVGGSYGQLSFSDLGVPLDQVTFVVVDLETTGTAPEARSITEFGAVKVRGGEVLGEFATLVNPGVPIAPFITVLTGITTAMVYEAPDIYSVFPAFLEFLHAGPDTVLVAHNARFDVSHLKAAAVACDMPWPRVKVLDTVRLARRVFTKNEAPNAKLGTLARICRATVTPTHRALDDARATVDVLHTMLGRLGPLGVTHLDDLLTASDPVPAKRRKKATLADGLPQSPGVYRFIGPGEEIMYVGTSVNIYKRVRQYFTAAENRKRIAEMVDLAERVEATPTATVLEARILELRQIATYDPRYNRRSRHPENRPWVILTDEPHPRIKTVRKLPFDQIGHALGPFSSGNGAKRASVLVADTAHLRTCTSKLPESPSPNAVPCHLAGMGKCFAPCASKAPDPAPQEAARIIEGDFAAAYQFQMERLTALASGERFEQAAEERDRLSALHTVMRRKERLLPLLQAPLIVATKKSTDIPDRWEVVLIQYGRLSASALVDPGEQPPDTARRLTVLTPLAEAPQFAGQATSVEETEILASWLWDENTRLLEFTGSTPLVLPRHGASRHQLPRIQSIRELD